MTAGLRVRSARTFQTAVTMMLPRKMTTPRTCRTSQVSRDMELPFRAVGEPAASGLPHWDGWLGDRLRDRGRGRSGRFVFVAWEPLEPAREVPVPVAEELHRRRQEYGADDGGVDEYGGGESDPELLEEEHRERGEDREHADHDDSRAGDNAGRRLDPVRDRGVGREATVVALPDAAEDEDVVVHREAEEDHEQEQGHDRVDAAGGVEAEEALSEPVLEDEHEHAVGGGDREDVQQ